MREYLKMDTFIESIGLQWIAQEIFSYRCRSVSKLWQRYMDQDTYIWKQVLMQEKMKFSLMLIWDWGAYKNI